MHRVAAVCRVSDTIREQTIGPRGYVIDVSMRIRPMILQSYTLGTNSENASVKRWMDRICGEKAIANIVNINKFCYIVVLMGSIFYDEPKPLKKKEVIRWPSIQVCRTSEPRLYGMTCKLPPNSASIPVYTQHLSRRNNTLRVSVVLEDTAVLDLMTSMSTTARSAMEIKPCVQHLTRKSTYLVHLR